MASSVAKTQRACHSLRLIAQLELAFDRVLRREPQFELLPHDRAEVAQGVDVPLAQLPRLLVDHAQRPEVEAILRGQRHSGVEAQAELARHQRIGECPGVDGRVLEQPRAMLQDRRRAHAVLAIDLLDVDAVMRLEPDPVAIDDARDGDRNVKVARGQRRDPIERAVRGRVQDRVAAHRLEALVFMGPSHSLAVHRLGLPAQSRLNAGTRAT
jgi:hypothetical protein